MPLTAVKLVALREGDADHPPLGASSAARTVVAVRGFQWNHPLAQDVIFWVYEITNECGVDYDDVTAQLEKEGVEKFIVSWNELLDTVTAALEASK